MAALPCPCRGQRFPRLPRPGLSFPSPLAPPAAGQSPAPLRPRAARPGAGSAAEPRLLRRRRHRSEDPASRRERPCGGQCPRPAPAPRPHGRCPSGACRERELRCPSRGSAPGLRGGGRGCTGARRPDQPRTAQRRVQVRPPPAPGLTALRANRP